MLRWPTILAEFPTLTRGKTIVDLEVLPATTPSQLIYIYLRFDSDPGCGPADSRNFVRVAANFQTINIYFSPHPSMK